MASPDRYEFQQVEKKWQQRWRDADLFRAEADPARPKYYGLEFFPYPSGEGLSVGHFKNYAPTDAYLRYKSMRGYNVLHPMGWDAFGQPAENEAIKRKLNPRSMVPAFAANYKRQMDLIGLSYDWNREVNSSDPEYYRWTQWIFLLLFRKGLAYRAEAPVNWCPVDKTVLANEEVVNGRCWRCGSVVEHRKMPQWFFRITAYADRLISDLESLEWPEGIKAMQRNWIGRSEGAHVDFSTSHGAITVFTTRPDTLWGATFMVLAPEHPLVDALTRPDQQASVTAYRDRTSRETEIERQAEGREKTGIWTGSYATNPASDEQIPVWIADYVLMGYGTGAIMAVPAHDQRDFDFARKFSLPIRPVYQEEPANPVSGASMQAATTDRGILTESGPFNGRRYSKETVGAVSAWLEQQGTGKAVTTYRLRDWLISRQRYWGAPIPIIHCPDHGEVAVPDADLPVELPDVQRYAPAETGESPLATIAEFTNCACPVCGKPARRETDTMGGFACSSWYFLRFADPRNTDIPFSREAADYWLPVDMYVGGAEHAVMHLLYARFWTKVLYDEGLIGFTEPFKTLRNQGMMLAWTPGRHLSSGDTPEQGSDVPIDDWKVLLPEELASHPPDKVAWRWVKMSKSMRNVVTPDEAAEKHGADAVRVYEMFVAPFEENVQWSDDGIRGAERFLSRVYRLVTRHASEFKSLWKPRIGLEALSAEDAAARRKTHQTVLKVTADIEEFRFNTAIAAMMEWINAMYDYSGRPGYSHLVMSEAVENLVLLLAPFAPHLADEMWETLGQKGYLYRHPWPTGDESLAQASQITLVVQVNGKVRDKIIVPADTDRNALQMLAMQSDKVAALLGDRPAAKVIVVPGKLVNIVTE